MTETYAYSCESDFWYQQLTAGWKSVEASYSIYIYFITISSVLGIVTQTNLVSAISRVTFYLSFYRTVVIITYVITIVMNTRWWGSPGDPNDEGQNVIEHSFDTATTRSKELIAHVVLGNHKWEKKKSLKIYLSLTFFFCLGKLVLCSSLHTTHPLQPHPPQLCTLFSLSRQIKLLYSTHF